METLFSLEVIVNYVKIKKLDSKKLSDDSNFSCLFPCVAFRLLDYPTIAINLLENHQQEDIKLLLDESINGYEKLPVFKELLDKHGRYVFSKGKSCLFRCEQKALSLHLKHTPMYLMLLDTYYEPYKLLGTTVVPLINLINDISSETNESIDHEPCSKMTHGVFEIKNLMGDEIGIISFACRLTSFGSSLLNHIGKVENKQLKNNFKVKKISTKKTKKRTEVYQEEKCGNQENVNISENDISEMIKNISFCDINLKSNDRKNSTNKLESTNISNAFVQTSIIDSKDVTSQTTEVCIQEETIKNSIKPLQNYIKGESCAKKRFNSIKKSKKENYVCDDTYVDSYCPPVLFYNSEATLKNETIGDSIKFLKENELIYNRIGYLNKAKNEQEISTDQDSTAEDISQRVNTKTDQKKTDEIKVQNAVDLTKMPIFQGLIKEFDLLKNIHNQNNSSFTKHIDTLLSAETNKKKSNLKQPKSEKSKLVRTHRNLHNNIAEKKLPTTFPRNQNKNSINRENRNIKLQDNAKITAEENVTYESYKGEKQSSIMKKILKYGTTRAHEMRVSANRPASIKTDLKRESLKKKIISNIKEINASLTESFNNSNENNETQMSKNLDKVFFETIDSTVRGSINQSKHDKENTNFNTTKETDFDYSLLNKVEMDNTNFQTTSNVFVNSQQISNHNKSNFIDELIEDQSFEENFEKKGQSKIVQFGNTYVLNASISQSPCYSVTEEDSRDNNVNTNYNRNSYDLKDEPNSDRNIFLNNRDDCNSSVEISLHNSQNTSAKFFTNENLLKHVNELKSDKSEDSYDELDYLGKSESQSNFLENSKHTSNYNSSSFITDSIRSSR